MSETGKILDVTYGAFSCRLEGFDDAVETMKTVVTFFHELAGHENFMDVTLRDTDVDAVAEIAAKQAGTPVDAETDETNRWVSLRARRPEIEPDHSDDDQAPAEEAAEPETIPAEDMSEDEIAEEYKGITAPSYDEDEIADEYKGITAPSYGDETAEDDTAETAEDEIADEYKGITAPSYGDETAEDDTAETAEDEIADEYKGITAPSYGDETAEDDTAETAEDEIADEYKGITAPSYGDETAEDDTAEEETGDAAVAAEPETVAESDIDTTESVAAKLQRIRAVVGRSAPAQETSDTFAEDLTEEPAAKEPAAPRPAVNPLAQRLAELAKRNAALAAADDESKDGDTRAESQAEAIRAQTRPLLDDDDLEEDDAQAEEEQAAFSGDDTEDDDEFAENILTEELSEPADDADEQAADNMLTDDAFAEDTDDDDEGGDASALSSQVAEVEQELALRRENRSKRDELPKNVDAAISRILSQADEHLNEPEGRRHRDAFAQLKAAVAATEAARRLGDSGAEARDPGEVFREDLDAHETAKAVEDAEDEHNAPAAPTPLRLVPAQRVDNAPAGGFRPADRLRQIASQMDSEDDDDGGFAEFAEKNGLTDLLDLIEAAGAYIAFAEGDDDFSRPQVMKKVQMASPDELSREDGLRAFGRLLREKRIVKLNNGRFQVSPDTRFRPGSKAAQG